MTVDLTDIISFENKEVDKIVPIDLVSIELKHGSYPITKKEEMKLRIRNEENKRLFLTGSTQLELEAACDCCLEKVVIPFDIQVDKEIALDQQNEEEENYILGVHLDFDRIIYDEVLVNWPMKVLCKEDCAGICMTCGTNLNHGSCSCDHIELDPRMAVIQDVFNKYKEV